MDLVFSLKKIPIYYSMYFDVSDGRMIFAVKRDDIVYLGTIDTEYRDRLKEPICNQEDVQYL